MMQCSASGHRQTIDRFAERSYSGRHGTVRRRPMLTLPETSAGNGKTQPEHASLRRKATHIGSLAADDEQTRPRWRRKVLKCRAVQPIGAVHRGWCSELFR